MNRARPAMSRLTTEATAPRRSGAATIGSKERRNG
jgi:hypothetical protein